MSLTPDQELWLQALESGRYAQTKGYLNVLESEVAARPEGFCCLGVACDLFLKNEGRATTTLEAYDDIDDEFLGEVTVTVWFEDPGTLPYNLAERLGLNDNNGTFYGAHEVEGKTMLTQLNDDLGWTFPQIAAWIRANPHMVFDNV